MNFIKLLTLEIIRLPGRFWLGTIISACVIAVLISQMTLQEAGVQRIRRIMAQMGNNLLFLPKDASVDAWYSGSDGQAEMAEGRARYLARTCPVMSKHATHFVEKLQFKVQLSHIEALVTGFNVIKGEHQGGEQKRRRSFLDDPLATGHLLSGSEIARRQYLAPGDTIFIKDRPFKVHAIVSELGGLDDIRLWIPLEDAQRIAGKSGLINGVDALGCLCSGQYFKKIMEEARQSVPDLRIIHSDVIAKTRENSRIATERIGAFISVVLTLLGMFSITLLTWYEMKLRRQETGVLLAMGMGAYYVAGLIGIKLLIMGSLGGLFGWVLGSALAYWGAPFLWNLPAEIPVLLLPSLLPITIAAGAVLSCSAGAVVVMSMVFRDPITLLTSTKRK